jgi:Protein of unknown function (DUF3106)
MTTIASTRCSAFLAALASAVACVCMSVPAQSQGYGQRTTPAPIERRPPATPAGPQQPQPQQAPVQRRDSTPGKLPNGQHLSGWFDQHSSQTPTQKLQALEREPGFHALPPQTQQRMRDRLTELNNMTPEKRARVLAQNEAMEQLTADQRAQVRNAMALWAALPPASHRAVGRTFRVVRGMPPAQRLAYLNSPDIRSQFTPQERDTLAHLMAIEPYLPPPAPFNPNP